MSTDAQLREEAELELKEMEEHIQALKKNKRNVVNYVINIKIEQTRYIGSYLCWPKKEAA